MLAAALELWSANLEFILPTIQAPPHRFLYIYADKEHIIIALDIITSPANHIEGFADIHSNSRATQKLNKSLSQVYFASVVLVKRTALLIITLGDSGREKQLHQRACVTASATQSSCCNVIARTVLFQIIADSLKLEFSSELGLLNLGWPTRDSADSDFVVKLCP